MRMSEEEFQQRLASYRAHGNTESEAVVRSWIEGSEALEDACREIDQKRIEEWKAAWKASPGIRCK